MSNREKRRINKSQDCKTFTLNNSEHIKQVILRSGWVVDSLSFVTDENNKYFSGGEGGSKTDLNLKNRVIIGTYGLYGTHLYAIGFYQFSKEDFFHYISCINQNNLHFIRLRYNKDE